MSEVEPIQFSPRRRAGAQALLRKHLLPIPPATVFTRLELNQILNLYGRKVADGEWRDYAIDFGREKAVFSVFRRASEVPLYRIEKNPRLARAPGRLQRGRRHRATSSSAATTSPACWACWSAKCV